MKKVIKTLLLFLPIIASAQSNQVAIMAGYKAGEISATYTAKSEVIYGFSFAVVDSEIAEKRANNRDLNKHVFNDKYLPGAFGLLGAKFDNFSIIGKLGSAYVNQSINNIEEQQKFYFTAGIAFDFKMSESFGLRASYDSVSSLLVGVTYHL